jgi:hypothetical protein
MSLQQTRPPSRRRRRRRLLPRLLPRLLLVAAIAVAFLVGLGLGETLHDSSPHGTQTLVRTLRPLFLPPAGQATVTLTTSTR